MDSQVGQIWKHKHEKHPWNGSWGRSWNPSGKIWEEKEKKKEKMIRRRIASKKREGDKIILETRLVTLCTLSMKACYQVCYF